MRYLFVFIIKCLSVIVWCLTYLGYMFANIGLYLWYFNKNKLLTWYMYSEGVNVSIKASFYDYLNTCTYEHKVKKKRILY